MDKDKAIEWAVKQLKTLISYNYYHFFDEAQEAADAMTALTGQPWCIRSLANGHWVEEGEQPCLHL